MKRAILIISIVLLIFGCNNDSKNNRHIVSSYIEINELVKQVIEADTTKSIFNSNEIHYSLFSSDAIFQIENLDDFVKLSDDDIKLMKLQDSIFTWAHLHPGIFNEYRLIDNDTIRGMYRTYSVPLLSQDKKYLVIEIGYDVGFLSGRGYLVIFEKIDNKWIEKHRFFQWIS